MRINIVDPGSAKQIVNKKSSEGSILDQIGIASRTHEPMGACYVGAYAQKQGHGVRIVYPKSQNLSIEEVLEENPEMVAFSAMTFNYPLALEIAKRIKIKKPEIKTAIGGYHATCLPIQTSKEPAFDFSICCEADWTLSDLAEYLEKKRSRQDIRGIIYENGSYFNNNFQRIDPNLNPIPLRTKEMMEGRKRYEIFDPAPSKQKGLALIVGSRGCEYGCKFCLSSTMFPKDEGVKVRYRDVGNIIDEINDCKKRFDTNALFFVDLNFYGGRNGRIKKLCNELAKLKINWYAMARVDTACETFEDMKRGGCIKVGLGIESLVKPLKAGVNMCKGDWQDFVKSKTNFLRELGILTKGYFILNDDGEGKQDIEDEKQAILESGCDDIRLSFMIYSPGTQIFNRLRAEQRLVTEDLTKFSTDYPVIRNPNMPPEELIEKRKDIYRAFFTSRKYKEKMKIAIARTSSLAQGYADFNQMLINTLGEGFSD
jgi:radical SAM superfamily enzyme YgiQ (UPF0313 family)